MLRPTISWMLAALSIIASLIFIGPAAAECTFKNGKSLGQGWTVVPCQQGGRSGGGSSNYGGSSNNNLANGLAVGGAALGLLGVILQNAERDQQELEQERDNQAARAQQLARNRFCHQKFEKATALYKLASFAASFSAEKAIDSYEDAIEVYAVCGEHRAIKQTRDQIARLRQFIVKRDEQNRLANERALVDELIQKAQRVRETNAAREISNDARDEAVQYTNMVQGPTNHTEDKSVRPALAPVQPAPDRLRDRRRQELEALQVWYNDIRKMPGGAAKDEMLDRHRQILKTIVETPNSPDRVTAAGPRTCATVSGQRVCSEYYNDPIFTPKVSGIPAPDAAANSMPRGSDTQIDERLQGIPDGRLDYR